jgi:hypothetical protein
VIGAIEIVIFYILGTVAAGVILEEMQISRPWSGIAALFWPISLGLIITVGTFILLVILFLMFINLFVNIEDKFPKILKATKNEQKMVPKETLVWMIEIYQAWRPDDSYGPWDTDTFIEVALAQGEGYDEFGEKIKEED